METIIENIWWLVALAGVSFVQNMAFTLVSRSRNSADTVYHFFCALASNGVWFVCQVLIVKNIWSAIARGEWWYALLAGLIYTIFTAQGSTLMMAWLLKKESGKRRVGARLKEING